LQSQGSVLANGLDEAGHWTRATILWAPTTVGRGAGIVERDGLLVATFSGRLDHRAASDVEARLTPLVEDSTTRGIVLDFAAVEYISSVGLRALMIMSKRAQLRALGMAIAAARPLVREILSVSRFDRVLPVFETCELALVAVATKPPEPPASAANHG